MIMSRDQNIVPNGTIKVGDLSFEEVEKFKYLGATVTNINDTREEIKRRINMGNACYYSVQKLLSSSLLSKNLKVRIYKTVILPITLYGCETWTLTLREKHRLRVFKNKVLRKIFGAKRVEVTGEWRNLHNTELHALYSSPDIIRNIKSRRLRWAGHVARMGESRNAYRVLVGRPKGKRPLGRPRRRWEDIKMDLREVGYDDRDWINLAQDRDQWRAYMRAAMNLRIQLLMNQAFGSPLQGLPTNPLELAGSDSDSMASTPDDGGFTVIFPSKETEPAGIHSSPDSVKAGLTAARCVDPPVDGEDSSSTNSADQQEQLTRLSEERKVYVRRVSSRVYHRVRSTSSTPSTFPHLFQCILLVGLNLDSSDKKTKVPYIKTKYPLDVSM
ncbi:hypothetical protein ANN_05912 [Periplaneta americana]|uniref:Endonuclease-reverse transcriptase n=1 Tax=Periplaneta americana TaxID=6978 RepID=A0ABQ8TDV8_PERAM|nr:hypothetical protein ANN_05912 [Periplaneta americana]